MAIEKPCKRCGKCCSLTINITASDILRWHREREIEILSYLDILPFGVGVDAWIDPKTGEELDTCPFLIKHGRKTSCGIEHTKPFVCRTYSPGRCFGYNKKLSLLKTKTGKRVMKLEKESDNGKL